MFKGYFEAVAAYLDLNGHGVEAIELKRASTHWLRHSFGSHSVANIDGALTLPQLQKMLGHDSLATTGIYTDADLGGLHQAAGDFAKRAPLGYRRYRAR